MSWLVQKRMLWDTNHELVSDTIPSGGPSLTMPMWDDNRGLPETLTGTVAVLPPNRYGDRCDTNGQRFCGWWFSHGWETNDNSMPDPEDWAPGHFGNGYAAK